jgi:excisionase family DNA binding protein
MDPLLTIPQVAELLQISKSKLYDLVQKNKIPHIRIGRNVRIRPSDLEEWLKDYYIPSMEDSQLALKEIIEHLRLKKEKKEEPLQIGFDSWR